MLTAFYSAIKENFSDVLNLGRHIMTPNKTRISKIERRVCLLTGIGSLVAIIALKIFMQITWQTFKVLATICAVPLMAGVTGIPVFVYVSCAIAPSILFIIAAISFSIFFPLK